MTSHCVTTAMILAAGRGQRMRPLTDHTPKPLLYAGKNRLIEWQILRLVAAGIRRIVINHAWLGEQFQPALGNGNKFNCQIIYSHEPIALETAGGIAYALPELGSTPFIVVSGDIYTDYDYTALTQHDLTDTLAHLVLVPNPPYHVQGDMGITDQHIDPTASNKHTYANIGLFNPRLFSTLAHNTPYKLFPWLYAQGPISGEIYTGVWHNVGTPEQLTQLNETLTETL